MYKIIIKNTDLLGNEKTLLKQNITADNNRFTLSEKEIINLIKLIENTINEHRANTKLAKNKETPI